MNNSELWDQTKLAEHWLISEGTLERWRSEGIGPVYMKINGHVRYRISDVISFLSTKVFEGVRPSLIDH